MGYVEVELLNERNEPRLVKMNDEDCYDVYVWRENKYKPSYWLKLKIQTIQITSC